MNNTCDVRLVLMHHNTVLSRKVKTVFTFVLIPTRSLRIRTVVLIRFTFGRKRLALSVCHTNTYVRTAIPGTRVPGTWYKILCSNVFGCTCTPYVQDTYHIPGMLQEEPGKLVQVGFLIQEFVRRNTNFNSATPLKLHTFLKISAWPCT